VTRKELFIADLLPPVIDLTRRAGALIMSHYKQGGLVDRKLDASPVTEADRAADRLIVAALKILAPHIPVVSEEGDKPDAAQEDCFWLVDPLDGTKSFVRGSGYFTVNIGLIGGNKTPIMGAIYDPVEKVMYYGSADGAFCEREGKASPIRVRKNAGGNPLAALVSHAHLNTATEEYLSSQPIAERIPCASSIKFCWLAEGKADLYPRFGPTMEWDTAAGHAILLAAGGRMTTPEGEPFLYGKKGFLNGNFIASAS